MTNTEHYSKKLRISAKLRNFFVIGIAVVMLVISQSEVVASVGQSQKAVVKRHNYSFSESLFRSIREDAEFLRFTGKLMVDSVASVGKGFTRALSDDYQFVKDSVAILAPTQVVNQVNASPVSRATFNPVTNVSSWRQPKIASTSGSLALFAKNSGSKTVSAINKPAIIQNVQTVTVPTPLATVSASKPIKASATATFDELIVKTLRVEGSGNFTGAILQGLPVASAPASTNVIYYKQDNVAQTGTVIGASFGGVAQDWGVGRDLNVSHGAILGTGSGDSLTINAATTFNANASLTGNFSASGNGTFSTTTLKNAVVFDGSTTGTIAGTPISDTAGNSTIVIRSNAAISGADLLRVVEGTDPSTNIRFSIDNAGNVGVATTTPGASAKFGVAGVSYLGGNTTVEGALTVTGTFTSGALSVAGHLTPTINDTYDLGTTSTPVRWRYGNLSQGLLVSDGTNTSTLGRTS
ncbi:MAG: Peptidase S74 protein, partial [Candidatus Magasanikbacteria bacterium]|nr:Peptidase S74 protein [Candidatus Magasanikbacteria bacterium]